MISRRARVRLSSDCSGLSVARARPASLAPGVWRTGCGLNGEVGGLSRVSCDCCAGERDRRAGRRWLHLRIADDLAQPGLVPIVELFGVDRREQETGMAVVAAVVGGDHGVERVIGAQTLLEELLVVDVCAAPPAPAPAPASCRLPRRYGERWPSDPPSIPDARSPAFSVRRPSPTRRTMLPERRV